VILTAPPADWRERVPGAQPQAVPADEEHLSPEDELDPEAEATLAELEDRPDPRARG
jgi:hypothetical protein